MARGRLAVAGQIFRFGLVEEMGRVEKLLSVVAAAFEFVAVVMMAVMAGFVILSSVMRYFVGAPLHFTEELVGLLFAMIVFLALPRIELDGRHIRIDLFDRLIGSGFATAQAIARLLLTLAVYVWFGREALSYGLFMFNNKSATLIGDIPIFPWVGAIIAALGLSAAIVVVAILRVPGQLAADREGPHP